MRRFAKWRMSRLMLTTPSLLLCGNLALAADPGDKATRRPDNQIQLVQDVPPPPVVQPSQVPTGAAPGTAPLNVPIGFGGTTPNLGGGSGSSTQTSAAQTGPSNVLTASDAAARPGGDLGNLLANSAATTGVEIQKRGSIISDPRVRGYHGGQLITFADGAFFTPAREDLDTAISKIDPGAVRNVVVLKGPYSVLYGPGFAFFDIATQDAPRYRDGFEAHGSTGMNYQTNGDRWQGGQVISGGDCNWGFRLGYDIRAGNDYRAGDGRDVPGSYNSQSLNGSFGYDFSPDSRVELKALRLDQRNIEFPGLYFDINRLVTNGYSLRYSLENQEYFDRLSLDLWYNHTAVIGTTQQGAKQAFLTTFLTTSFTPPGVTPPPGYSVQDRSLTDFSEMSRGYRVATTWGKGNDPRLTVGTDLNYLNKGLLENIRLIQTGGVDLAGFGPSGFQDLGVPKSRLVDPGIFAEASVPVNKKLTFKSGFRADWVNTVSNSRVVNGNIPILPGTPFSAPVTSFDPIVFSQDPDDPNLERNFGLLSAYISGDYKIDSHLTALASFGYAERPPSLTELYAAGPFVAVLQQGFNRIIGDPHMDPERVRQMDVGLRGDYGWFRGGVNGFYAWIADYITFDQNKAGGAGINQVIFTNTDLATLAGFEMFSEMDVTCWLTPFANVSYVQGRDLTHIDNRRSPTLVSSRRVLSTEPLPGIPPLEMRTGLRVHESRDVPRWGVEGTARFVMGQNLAALSLGELPTSGFTIFDMRAFWQATEDVYLIAGVENIGDKFYREHLDPRAGDQFWRQGTNFYFGAQVKY